MQHLESILTNRAISKRCPPPRISVGRVVSVRVSAFVFIVAAVVLSASCFMHIMAVSGGAVFASNSTFTTSVRGVYPIATERGRVNLRIASVTTNSGSSSIVVAKPSSNATVRRAFLMCTSHEKYEIVNGDILLDGTPIFWDESVRSSASGEANFFSNVMAEVTAQVRSKFESATGASVAFVYQETQTTSIDGCALYVIFDDPEQSPESTVILLFGSMESGDERYALRMAEPLEKGEVAELGVAISFSNQGFSSAEPHQCGSADPQYSLISVNGSRLTSCAGNSDDGAAVKGLLLTVGDSNDSLENPDEPLQQAADGETPRTSDDELYNLAPLVAAERTTVRVDITNPSRDDNLFASHLFLPKPAIVGEGILLAPLNAQGAVGAQSATSAIIQDDDGLPIANRRVTFKIDAGPNQGKQFSVVTDQEGRAPLRYTSDITGTDSISAFYVGDGGQTRVSNHVTQVWHPAQYTLALSPPDAAHTTEETHTALVRAMDSWGNAVPSQTVQFLISGTHELSATRVTTSTGTAAYTYEGKAAGQDRIDAWLDLNQNAQMDGGEPAASANVTWEPVTAIQLRSFTALWQGDTVHIQWETAVEIDNVGFHLYRSASSNGPWERVNEQLIGAHGNGTGAEYYFTDASPPTPTGTLYYTLEDIDYYGVGTTHGPVMAQAPTVDEPLLRNLFVPIVREHESVNMNP